MNNVLLNVSWKGTTSICRAASLGTKQESSSVIIATGILRNGMGHSVVQENSNTTFKQSEPWEREQKKEGSIDDQPVKAMYGFSTFSKTCPEVRTAHLSEVGEETR